jgi:two-component system sensor histidine kinase HydH
MGKKMPILRVAGPTMLMSLLLFIACTVSAFLLYRLHADTAEVLADDIDSRRIATEIETTLRNLARLVRSGSDQVESLHDSIVAQLAEARDLANSPEEMALETRLNDSFEKYRELWENRFDLTRFGKNEPVKSALRVLENEAIPSVVRLRDYNNAQILKSEEELRKTVKWFAWGLIAVGCIGSLAGVLLGYGVARALRHSIYQLSVRIRDAADKLKHDLPTVTINQGDGIDYLHDQMQSLLREIEQMVEKLHQREREILRAEQMAAVGQLAAGVAHELRNPLTAVKMLVETSREDLEKRGVPAEDLQIIEHEIRRLEGSLQTFLDFARPPRMERRRLDLAPVLEQALALIGGRAKKQGVQVEFLSSPPVALDADSEQLRQLLVNLCMNALDVMPTGGTLKVRVRPLPGHLVAVEVCDSGPGISPDIYPRLFTPFVSGKETGLGLGLVLSRRIAEDHGGTLTASNHPDGGACLTLTLPTAE